jgi:hypothetical protein
MLVKLLLVSIAVIATSRAITTTSGPIIEPGPVSDHLCGIYVFKFIYYRTVSRAQMSVVKRDWFA